MDNDLLEIPVKPIKNVFVHQSQDESVAQANIFWIVQVAAAVRVPQHRIRHRSAHRKKTKFLLFLGVDINLQA